MTPPFLPALRALPTIGQLSLAALAAGTVALTMRLWPQWRANPDLSHGVFMPFLFLLLLKESRAGTIRHPGPGAGYTLGITALIAGALLALVAAGLYAAAVDWSHALVNLMLVLCFTLFTWAAALIFAGQNVRLVSFNWQIIVAAGLWLLAAPIPPGTYTRLTLMLQLWVSEGVLQTLHLVGIAAIRHGNIIDLANASVGVEEACSGVRSLISCVFAAVFFSGTLVRQPWARAVIIALSVPLALGMNFARSLCLTLLAANGVDIAGTWHDATGFAVLGLTAVLLGALALFLERGRAGEPPAPPPAHTLDPDPSGAQWMLGVSLGVAALLVAGFVWNTRPSSGATAPVPDLLALLPDSPAGWRTRTANLYQFRGTLQTEHLAQRDYLRPAAEGGPPIEIVIYVAYWRAGQAPVSLVASHTPDACWPGAGWTPLANPQPRATLAVSGRLLPEAEHRLFAARDAPYHVWFWHLHGGRPIAYRDPYSALELIRLAWQFGFRRDGDQAFIRISGNRPWDELQEATPLRDFFARVRSMGL